MTSHSFEFLALTEPEHLYIILDGNFIENLNDHINAMGSHFKATSLYKSTTLDHLDAISPWIVELSLDDKVPLINWALENQYFDNAAWLFSSNNEHADIVQHFRSLLFVKHPNGGEYIFRFHDPRIAEALLQSHYKLEQNNLAEPLNTAWFYKENRWMSINFTSWQVGKTQSLQPPYCLTDQDIVILSDVTMVTFTNKLDRHINTHFPEWYEDKNRTPTHNVIKLAKQLGFVSERAIFFFTNVLGYLGESVIKNQHYQDIHELLTKTSLLTPEQRAEKAAELAYQYHQGSPNG